MNDEIMSTIAWKIRSEKDTTLWQLHNGTLVDIVEMPPGKVAVRPYRDGLPDPDYHLRWPVDREKAFSILYGLNHRK